MENKVSTKNAMAIIAVALVSFSGIMAETAMNVTFPVLTRYFSTSLNSIQWVTTAYLLSVTIMITTSAYLNKRYNTRYLWLASLIFFATGTLVGGLASNLPVLLIGRVLEGLAAGISMPLMFNLIVQLVPRSKIGVWMGIGSMVVSLAPSFGPTYGGALIDTLGWRSIFFILLIVPIISLLLGWRTIDNSEETQANVSFDVLAFGLLSVSLITALILINQLENGTVNILLLGVTIVSLTGFVIRSLTSKQTFLNIRLLSNSKFLFLLLPVVLYMFANLGINLLLPNYSQKILNTSSFWAGFSLLPGTLLGGILNPYFGHLYDKHGDKTPLLVGNMIFGISLLVMAYFTKNLGIIAFILMYMIFTFGRNMAFSIGMTASIDELSRDKKTDATAILQSAQMFMGALGTTVAALYGAQKSGLAVGFQHFLWLLFFISLVIFIMFFARQKTGNK
ncbi:MULTISPECIES: MFS transporter [Leuconostoc]|jgi:EmrB/QacA subfamily drug resistance transporter|uniref:MFS transporter n=1 Tax=Leuconostoc mesenteroides TaxID=1245 RepID=A0A843Z1G3_LEUME|nr:MULTISPECIES: MFS transporter [Leuconostoc]ARN63411.1 MFS transporter permease [Leuconostoc mesenteroides subsp. mesenteroides]KAA8369222.1 multidrug efflux MFS transporter [Leuconostoc mesenteroides]MBZ1514814.1 MFS transporter [Leuconostoc mesenteroides]MBZ1518448.1 MFS transporter [Leuconostoc mesenteroides]MBZ1521182.1 MFS transporter [Leuconostoc mesenteroides]